MPLLHPKTKNTIQDFLWLKQSGFAEKIVDLAGKGVPVIGVCGGFQMLGKELVDQKGIEGDFPTTIRGLGLLDVSTKFDFYGKTTNQLEAEIIGLYIRSSEGANNCRLRNPHGFNYTRRKSQSDL